MIAHVEWRNSANLHSIPHHGYGTVPVNFVGAGKDLAAAKRVLKKYG